MFPWSDPKSPHSDRLESIHEGLSKINPSKDAILRAIVTTTELPNIQDQKISKISSIAEEAIQKCAPILNLPQMNRISAFKDDLMKFLSIAIQIWEDAQKNEFSVVATSVLQEAVVAWGEHDEYDQVEVPTHAPQDSVSQTHGRAVAVLFPQVYQSKTDKPTKISRGVALWSDHTIYQLGRKEFDIQYKRTHEVSGDTTTRRVRQTVPIFLSLITLIKASQNSLRRTGMSRHE
jgi:hypothetical protein